MSGTHPEFFDSKFVSQGEGREVTRVKNTGVVKVTVNVMTKGMESFGYNSGGGGGGGGVNMGGSANFSTTGGEKGGCSERERGEGCGWGEVG